MAHSLTIVDVILWVTVVNTCDTPQVTDTEDLISIDLDHRRNELVALNLVVNCIMLMFALVSAVTGAFGMNFNAWMSVQSVATSRVRPLPHYFDGLKPACVMRWSWLLARVCTLPHVCAAISVVHAFS